MRRLIVIAGTALLVLAAAVVADAQTTVTTPTVPVVPATPLRASLDSCQTALVAGDRSAVFSGSMPPVARTRRMRMRFDLYVKRGSTTKWRRVRTPKWGIWHVSRPRVPGFVFTKVVDGLAAPASYRATVRFRWYDKHRQLIRSAKRTTAPCLEPDPRPDLRLSSLAAMPLSSGNARYTLVVANAGLGVAGPFGIVLAIGDRRVPIANVAGLAAGQQRAVTLDAPSCTSADKISILLDPDGTVDQAGGRDATVMRRCPL
jgi:hypothetical protein